MRWNDSVKDNPRSYVPNIIGGQYSYRDEVDRTWDGRHTRGPHRAHRGHRHASVACLVQMLPIKHIANVVGAEPLIFVGGGDIKAIVDDAFLRLMTMTMTIVQQLMKKATFCDKKSTDKRLYNIVITFQPDDVVWIHWKSRWEIGDRWMKWHGH